MACNCAPPDTNGEVGATQYVQMVNEGFQVFNKTTGASVFGPSGYSNPLDRLWRRLRNQRQRRPGRALRSTRQSLGHQQFAGVSVPTDECVAVSTTSDATGSYHRYGFHLGSNFFDYPHLGVWPDAYYMSMNVFNSSGTAFLGPQPFAFDRAKMLAGLPATFITHRNHRWTRRRNLSARRPRRLDSAAGGAPATFVEFPGGGTYRVFHFHVDFVTPAKLDVYSFRQSALRRVSRLVRRREVRAATGNDVSCWIAHRRPADVSTGLRNSSVRTKPRSATSR